MNPSVIQRHPLSTFFAASIVISWCLSGIGLMLPPALPLLLGFSTLISYAPALIAWWLLRRTGSDVEQKAFWDRLTHIRIGIGWWVIALGLPVLNYMIGVAFSVGLGNSWPKISLSGFALLPVFALINLGEDLGWRGYALPELQKRYAPTQAALTVGIVSAAYHWVATLGNPDPVPYILVSTLFLLGFSVVLAWLFNSTGGSIPLVTLFHATYNTLAQAVAPLSTTSNGLLALTTQAGVFLAGTIIVLFLTRCALGSAFRGRRAEAISTVQE